MPINDVMMIGWNILASFGGSAIILVALSSWLGKVWANRILENDKTKYISEMEAIKTNNQRYINALGVSNSTYIESRKAFNIERIQSIKLIWSELVKIKNSRPSPIIFLDIFMFNEYKQIYRNPKFDFFDAELDHQKLAKATSSSAEEARPFIDEKAFSYFWAYKALIGRLSMYVKKIREEGQPKKIWREESSILSTIKPIFSDEEMHRFQEEQWDTMVLLGYIETAFVNHLREIASGGNIVEDSLEHSMKLLQSASELRKLEQEAKLK